MAKFVRNPAPNLSVVRVATLSESEISDLLQEAARLGASQALESAGNQADDWLTLREAAGVLGISDSTLRKRAHDGTVKAYRVGKLWRFRRSQL
ncbi:MAG: excisionase family DNA-binding protein [Myxococcales bacterium]|nr:excisionase family DNA-binding protein [Myxococcales bacterium]